MLVFFCSFAYITSTTDFICLQVKLQDFNKLLQFMATVPVYYVTKVRHIMKSKSQHYKAKSIREKNMEHET